MFGGLLGRDASCTAHHLFSLGQVEHCEVRQHHKQMHQSLTEWQERTQNQGQGQGQGKEVHGTPELPVKDKGEGEGEEDNEDKGKDMNKDKEDMDKGKNKQPGTPSQRSGAYKACFGLDC